MNATPEPESGESSHRFRPLEETGAEWFQRKRRTRPI